MPKESTKKKNIDAIMEFNDNSSLDSPTRLHKNLNFKTQKQRAARPSNSINTITTKAAGDYLSDNGNGLSAFINQSDSVMQSKRKKLETFTIGAIKTSQQKVSELLDKQAESRKENREKLSHNLNAVLEQYQQDLSKMKDNEEKLQKMLTSQVKASQQATASHAQTLMAVRDMHSAYDKQCANLDEKHKSQRVTLETDMANEMHALHQQLLVDSRKESRERLRQTLLHAMQYDV